MIYKNKHDILIFNKQWYSIDDSIEHFFSKDCESFYMIYHWKSICDVHAQQRRDLCPSSPHRVHRIDDYMIYKSCLYIIIIFYLFISYTDMSPTMGRPMRGNCQKPKSAKEKSYDLFDFKMKNLFIQQQQHNVFTSFHHHQFITKLKFHIIKFFSIQLVFGQWKHWQQIRFNESFCQRFCYFKNNYQMIIIFHFIIYCLSYFIFFDIKKQFIITCFDVCLFASQKKFKWLNSEILCACKNFPSLIFFVRICVIKLLFIFTNLTCHFILAFPKAPFWAGVKDVSWPW